MPGNPLASRSGVDDPLQDAKTYIQHEAGNHFDEARVNAFLDNAGAMIDFLETNSEVKFNFGKNYPDYHPDHPGGAEKGRSIHPQLFDGRKLGRSLSTLAQQMPELTFMGMGLNSGPDLKHFLNATKSLRSALFVASRILAHGRDVMVHGRGVRLVNGNALAARLLKTALDRATAMVIVAGHPTSEGERPRCGRDRREGRQGRSGRRAPRIVFAAGGFPHDADRTRRHFKHLHAGAAHASLTPEGNTGDALRMAEDVNAALDDSFSNAAAWVPVSLITRKDGSVGRFFHLIDRAKPGVIAVTREGRRFTNESENYHDFVRAMMDACAGGKEVSAFMICDHRTIRRAWRGPPLPATALPSCPLRLSQDGPLDSGTSDVCRHRARKSRADHRGGQSRCRHRTRSRLQPRGNVLSTSSRRREFFSEPVHRRDLRRPFYAVKIIPGDIATYHGLVTDERTRVLDVERKPIPGLFAVGNDAASIFGGSYPGAGATLGPAMTFGYICGKSFAEQRTAD